MTRSFPFQALALAAILVGVPAAAQAACAGVKTGTYVALNPQEADLAWRVNLISVDATALTITDRDGTIALVPSADRCRYKLGSAEGPDVVFSKRGIFAAAVNDGTEVAVGMPVMPVTLRQMVGSWNFMRYEYDASTSRWHTYNGVAEVAASGVLKVSNCDAQGAVCGAFERIGVVTAHAEGGFQLTQRDGSTARLFGMKNGDARMMMGVDMGMDAFTVLAPTTARTLPTVGDTWSNWDLSVSDTGVPSTVGSASFRVVSVDATANTFRRKRLDDCVIQSWAINTGRTGLQHRAAGTGRNCADQRVTYGNNLVMPLTEGYGFSVYGWEAQDATQSTYFGISIRRP